MDWEAFERDVWQSVNESLYAYQEGSLDDSGPGYTGMVVTMGETWLGTLYVATEEANGYKNVQLFDTRQVQGEYFNLVCESMVSDVPEDTCNCTNPYCQV